MDYGVGGHRQRHAHHLMIGGHRQWRQSIIAAWTAIVIPILTLPTCSGGTCSDPLTSAASAVAVASRVCEGCCSPSSPKQLCRGSAVLSERARERQVLVKQRQSAFPGGLLEQRQPAFPERQVFSSWPLSPAGQRRLAPPCPARPLRPGVRVELRAR